MSAAVEFFFDLSSPWTRLAFKNIQAIVEETGADLVWRPFLVGGVFNSVNDSVYRGRDNPDSPKLRHTYRWLKDWADLSGVAMNFPSPHHPIKSVSAMRFCCALEADQQALFRFAERAFDVYFGEQQNIDDVDVLVRTAKQCGLDGDALARAAQTDSVKAALRANTQEAIERGAFGSPMIFVKRKFVYFGNDQLPIVRHRIQAELRAASPALSGAPLTT